MSLWDELEKEMGDVEMPKSEGVATSFTRAMLGDEAVDRAKEQAELKRKRQAVTDALAFFAGIVLILCLVAIFFGGTAALLLWWF